MKFAYFGYRSWAEEILRNLEDSEFEIDAYTIPDSEYSNNNFRGKEMKVFNPKEIAGLDLERYDALLFYGWSWIIKQDIVDNKVCVCLHPSPLPKYRGGSPIQHQIIDGEDESAVSLFKMGKELDDGPVYYQENFSLEGSLKDIFGRMVEVGSRLTEKLLKDFVEGTEDPKEQDEILATIVKRRKPEDSELSVEKLNAMTGRQIYDLIRSLEDPYPNAYLVGKEGKKVFLKGAELDGSND